MGTISNESTLYATDIEGFDELLKGGFALPPDNKGLIILLRGLPGTGKSTLALQIASGLATSFENKDKKVNVRIFNFEQTENENKPKIDKLGLFKTQNYTFESESKVEEETTFQELSFKNVEELILSKCDTPCLAIVDGLNLIPLPKEPSSSVQHNPHSDEQSSSNLMTMIQHLRDKSRVGILVYDAGNENKHVDFNVDVIIELKGEEEKEKERPFYYLNKLIIKKSRFQESALGWHQYKIQDMGVKVYPSPSFWVSKMANLNEENFRRSLPVSFEESKKPITEINENSSSVSIEDRPISIKDRSILKFLLGEIKKGSCTVVLGARRTWKTLLTLDFLRAGSIMNPNEHGLLISLMGNQSSLVDQRISLCNRYCYSPKENPSTRAMEKGCKDSKKCYQNVHLFHFAPGYITPSNFFHFLNKRIYIDDTKTIDRLVFWDLTQLGYQFPLFAQDPLFIPLLVDYLKLHHITSVFMGAPNAAISQCASAIADNVVFCWQDTLSVATPKEGVAFHVDRVEGKPETGDLFFLEVLEEQKNPKPSNNISEIFAKVEKTGNLQYGESMISHIRAMQGFPATK